MDTNNLYKYVNASAVLKELNKRYPEGFPPSAYRNLEKTMRNQQKSYCKTSVAFQTLQNAGIVYRSYIKDGITYYKTKTNKLESIVKQLNEVISNLS